MSRGGFVRRGYCGETASQVNSMHKAQIDKLWAGGHWEILSHWNLRVYGGMRELPAHSLDSD